MPKKRAEEKLVPVSVRLPESLVETLRRLADKQQRTFQIVVTNVIGAGLLAKENGK